MGGAWSNSAQNTSTAKHEHKSASAKVPNWFPNGNVAIDEWNSDCDNDNDNDVESASGQTVADSAESASVPVSMTCDATTDKVEHRFGDNFGVLEWIDRVSIQSYMTNHDTVPRQGRATFMAPGSLLACAPKRDLVVMTYNTANMTIFGYV
jgi:hypothetical protein